LRGSILKEVFKLDVRFFLSYQLLYLVDWSFRCLG
jgi:hypothetical protein